jgi:hypothetical protein
VGSGKEGLIHSEILGIGGVLSSRVFSWANVRDHRWLPVARSVPVERSGTSTERDAGSHSVDRIVGLYFFVCL